MFRTRTLLLAALMTTAAAGTAAATPGAVYTVTNDPAGNAVAVYARSAGGGLTPAGTVPTGGTGTGAGLGSANAVILDDDGDRLFAVDAGSDEIAAFTVYGRTPRRTAHVPSGGAAPVSLAERRGVLYVLNAGDAATPASITGFRVSWTGRLTPIPGSTQPLSAALPGAAQIDWAADGRHLIVTEKATNTIDVFPVDGAGRAGPARFTPTAAATPFGFTVAARGTIVVTNAAGGAPGLSGVSSFRIGKARAAVNITPFLGAGQTAACWAVASEDGRTVYVTNTGSGNVSTFRVGHDGALTTDRAVAASTGAGPADVDLVRDRFLYTLDGADRSISAFRVTSDGLVPIGRTAAPPTASAGLVGR